MYSHTHCTCHESCLNYPGHSVSVIILLYVCTDQNVEHFGQCRCLVSSHVTYDNNSATTFSLYLRHFRRPVSLLGFTVTDVSCNIKLKTKQKCHKFLVAKTTLNAGYLGVWQKSIMCGHFFKHDWLLCSLALNTDFIGRNTTILK